MNKDITLDTVIRQKKEMDEIKDLLECVEWGQESLIEIWGEKKVESILETLREEACSKRANMLINLGKLYKEE